MLASKGSLQNMILGLQSCIAVRLIDMSIEDILRSSSSLEASESSKRHCPIVTVMKTPAILYLLRI